MGKFVLVSAETLCAQSFRIRDHEKQKQQQQQQQNLVVSFTLNVVLSFRSRFYPWRW